MLEQHLNLKWMKFLFLMLILLSVISCKKEDPEVEEEVAEFAMTAKINGVLHELNNTFGKNEASSTTIYTYYPEEEYILLQGKKGAFGGITIQMWINRNDLKIGTYSVGFDTDGLDTHVDLIDNTNDENGLILENTASGSINITFVDLDAKRVKGTFDFKSTDGDTNADPINFTVTDGTFDYLYDVE